MSLAWTKGGAGGGLFKGALLGLAIGAVAGDAGRGAAIGTVGGGLFGGMRRHESRVDQQQWADQQSANYAASRNNCNRAYSACLPLYPFPQRKSSHSAPYPGEPGSVFSVLLRLHRLNGLDALVLVELTGMTE